MAIVASRTVFCGFLFLEHSVYLENRYPPCIWRPIRTEAIRYMQQPLATKTKITDQSDSERISMTCSAVWYNAHTWEMYWFLSQFNTIISSKAEKLIRTDRSNYPAMADTQQKWWISKCFCKLQQHRQNL